MKKCFEEQGLKFVGQDEEGERMEVVELEGESLSSWFVGVGWTRESVWRVMEQVFMWDPFRLSQNDSTQKLMVKIESRVPVHLWTKGMEMILPRHHSFSIIGISPAAQPQA